MQMSSKLHPPKGTAMFPSFSEEERSRDGEKARVSYDRNSLTAENTMRGMKAEAINKCGALRPDLIKVYVRYY